MGTPVDFNRKQEQPDLYFSDSGHISVTTGTENPLPFHAHLNNAIHCTPDLANKYKTQTKIESK